MVASPAFTPPGRASPATGVGADPQLALFGVPLWRDATPVDFRPERRFQLLAVLAVESGQWLAREMLAGLLWPERGRAEARRNLRKVVHDLHALALARGVEVADHALRWPVATDLLAFEALLRDGQIDAAAAWRRGVLLQGLDDEHNAALADWMAAQRRRVDEQWLAALRAALIHAPAGAARLASARRLLDQDPLDEPALAAVIEEERRAGREALALQAYRRHAERLAGEFGIEPSRRLRELAYVDDPVPPAPQAQPAFVGRRLERQALARWLADPAVRLMTVTGAGGIGKSRLAREVSRSLDGAAPPPPWIDLQDLQEQAAVAARLLGAFGLTVNERKSAAAQLGAHLAGVEAAAPASRTVVVFDNTEHLPWLPAWIDELLQTVPRLGLLVTSRTRLQLPNEYAMVLDGLPVPDGDSRDPEAAVAFDAVRLFDQRARIVQPDFMLQQHLDAVVGIVEAVGGLPLAIELAAAWVRLLPPAQIAADLRSTLDVLERDPARAALPARPDHRSMRAVLDQTWMLMAPRERDAMLALAVFQGGFTRDAAQAVAAVSLPLLSSLVDKSLVNVDAHGRFGMHPLVVADVAARAQTDEATAAAVPERQARHAAHYARLLETTRGMGDARALVATVDGEYANLRQAWRWALAMHHAPTIATMAMGWQRFFDVAGRYREGCALLREAIELTQEGAEAAHARACVRSALCVLLQRCGDLTAALALGQEAVRMAEPLGDRRLRVAALTAVGSTHSLAARWEDARPWFEQARAISLADGERGELASALLNLGVCDKKAGRFDEALASYSQALALELELGRDVGRTRCLFNIANVHVERGDWAKAREAFQRARAACLAGGVAGLQAHIDNGLATASFELGDFAAAGRHAEAAHETARRLEVRVIEWLSAMLIARLAGARGRLGEALERWRDLAARVRDQGGAFELLHVALYYGEWLRRCGRPADAAWAWQAVGAHPNAEAGLVATAVEWRGGLDDAAAQAPRPAAAGSTSFEPSTLEAVIEALLAEPSRPGDPATA